MTGVDHAAEMIRRFDLLRQLDVRIISFDRSALPVLLVDCETVMHGPADIRYWRLEQLDDGQWHHPGSGETGTLGACLWAIAATYTVDPQGKAG